MNRTCGIFAFLWVVCTVSLVMGASVRLKDRFSKELSHDIFIEHMTMLKEKRPKLYERVLKLFSAQPIEEKYTLENKILGVGLQGQIIPGQHRDSQKKVAIKEIPMFYRFERGQLIPSTDHVDQLCNEVFVLKQMTNHPNILHLEDVYVNDGVCYLITELIDGLTLDSSRYIVSGKTALEREARALSVLKQLLMGLNHLHSGTYRIFVHGDLHGSNIMVTHEGRVKITDFGRAHLATREKGIEEDYVLLKSMLPDYFEEHLRREYYETLRQDILHHPGTLGLVFRREPLKNVDVEKTVQSTRSGS